MNNSKLYTKNNSEQTEAAERFFRIFGEKLVREFGSKQISLIDIGSGCGKVLSEVIIKRSGLNIIEAIGVDKSDEMIKLSSKNYSNDFTTFCYMDAEGDISDTLKFKKFDIVTSFHCHHWVTNLEKGFQNIYDLLKPGGLFCCIFLSWHLVLDIWGALEDKYAPYTNNWRKNFTHLFFCDDADEIMKRELIGAGFEILEFYDRRNEIFDYQNIQNFNKAMEAVNQCLKSMPEEIREEYFKDQTKVLFSMQKEDPTVIPRRILYFIAKK